MSEIPKRKQGFACLTPERRREIAAMGGKAVKPENRSFSQSNDLARQAGRLGGMNVPPEKRSYSVDRDLAARSGQAGGNALHHTTRGGNTLKCEPETWDGVRIAKAMRLARMGKTLVHVREAIGSKMTIPAFREKARALGITFIRTRPKK